MKSSPPPPLPSAQNQYAPRPMQAARRISRRRSAKCFPFPQQRQQRGPPINFSARHSIYKDARRVIRVGDVAGRRGTRQGNERKTLSTLGHSKTRIYRGALFLARTRSTRGRTIAAISGLFGAEGASLCSPANVKGLSLRSRSRKVPQVSAAINSRREN